MDEVPSSGKNIATLKGNRHEGKFVCKNVKNLSVRNLYSAEILLLSKGFKFVRTANKSDQAKFEDLKRT